jgi:hypothetical protein
MGNWFESEDDGSIDVVAIDIPIGLPVLDHLLTGLPVPSFLRSDVRLHR